MNVPRFYLEHLTPGSVSLPADQARHAQGSRRLSVGDAVILFDGQGNKATGTISACSRRNVEVTLDEIVHLSRPAPALTLAVAPPKGPRQDMLIEKCTELGVAGIIPLQCERTVASASSHRLEKWHRTTIEAAKQSRQSWLPTLHELCSLEEVLTETAKFDQVLIATCEDITLAYTTNTQTVSPLPITDMLETLGNAQSILALIGPEGGFTTEEIAQPVSAGAQPVLLGPNTLRIETAAIALAATIHMLLHVDR